VAEVSKDLFEKLARLPRPSDMDAAATVPPANPAAPTARKP
jgi:hypothetical protein